MSQQQKDEGFINPNPVVYSKDESENNSSLYNERFTEDEETPDDFDVYEIFDLVRDINDPEHPLTLEQLNVVRHENIKIDISNNIIRLYFTPTVPHCSMANIIGLSIKEKLSRSLPQRFKVDVKVTPGSHSSEQSVNKQLNDKERVSAALDSSSSILNVSMHNVITRMFKC
ncbi:DUF59 family protein [Heterostelium album PN500]|uniref:DUF59 family protein n=1 Tax=Heterostelium pallidum (strain ATCC 26659 / Pp 5 / PN500) TaxID=670386 RepID=D3BHT1_HETP5|nr:DUF59 family protein [Heterostelium album PN500]EFA78831.1 DUF59 family protein [Heterostelium album PN500]|eukprot:XP_020430955.1 DUF59 family protein [Heterostelium album PN500]